MDKILCEDYAYSQHHYHTSPKKLLNASQTRFDYFNSRPDGGRYEVVTVQGKRAYIVNGELIVKD